MISFAQYYKNGWKVKLQPLQIVVFAGTKFPFAAELIICLHIAKRTIDSFINYTWIFHSNHTPWTTVFDTSTYMTFGIWEKKDKPGGSLTWKEYFEICHSLSL